MVPSLDRLLSWRWWQGRKGSGRGTSQEGDWSSREKRKWSSAVQTAWHLLSHDQSHPFKLDLIFTLLMRLLYHVIMVWLHAIMNLKHQYCSSWEEYIMIWILIQLKMSVGGWKDSHIIMSIIISIMVSTVKIYYVVQFKKRKRYSRQKATLIFM